MTPLTYTTDLPTTPGWYWMRLPFYASSRRVFSVHVRHDHDGALRAYYGGAKLGLMIANLPAGIHWAGPIPQPVEATK